MPTIQPTAALPAAFAGVAHDAAPLTKQFRSAPALRQPVNVDPGFAQPLNREALVFVVCHRPLPQQHLLMALAAHAMAQHMAILLLCMLLAESHHGPASSPSGPGKSSWEEQPGLGLPPPMAAAAPAARGATLTRTAPAESLVEPDPDQPGAAPQPKARTQARPQPRPGPKEAPPPAPNPAQAGQAMPRPPAPGDASLRWETLKGGGIAAQGRMNHRLRQCLASGKTAYLRVTGWDVFNRVQRPTERLKLARVEPDGEHFWATDEAGENPRRLAFNAIGRLKIGTEA